jgi:hypothetical protein
LRYARDDQVLDPFQFNFIVQVRPAPAALAAEAITHCLARAQVPGQTVALHIDAPYFWGASRFEVSISPTTSHAPPDRCPPKFPQWLLAVMVFSGLFQERMIDQIQVRHSNASIRGVKRSPSHAKPRSRGAQVVGYFHKWNDTRRERQGEFVFWNENTLHPTRLPPEPRAGARRPPLAAPRVHRISVTRLAGNVVDGSKTVHAASIYYPDRKAPVLSKAKENSLRFVGNDRWEVVSNGEVSSCSAL